MQTRSLSDWLTWQESLNPAEIELGLARIKIVAARLPLAPPGGAVFTVAGTNGKGSCSALLGNILRAGGRKTAVYSSPHLLRYNERIEIDGNAVSDAELVAAFEQIEAVRDGIALTFFEYGTLAAMLIFSRQQCNAWVLEVGLGGRLDAVNMVDADLAVITTVDIDHQDWLGDTIEEIAQEKAGIIRPHRPVFYGDQPVPEAVREQAILERAPLICLRENYTYLRHGDSWDWHGAITRLTQLPLPPGAGEEQLRNISLVLAVIERYDPFLLSDHKALCDIVINTRLPGRFQVLQKDHEWILDVAHNRQAADALRGRMLERPAVAAGATTIVAGMLADKQAQFFVEELAGIADQWITCSTTGRRGATAEQFAQRIATVSNVPVSIGGSVSEALEMALRTTPAGGRILVCGSFMVVGPALQWLRLY